MTIKATIIYGRTLDEGFRLLVKPNDFGKDETEWAKKCILATVRSDEKLPSGKRWAVFQNEKHCIVGVACMASELSSDMNTDGKRNLYTFVGLVGRDYFGVPTMDVEPFRKAYEEYVRPRWLDKFSSHAEAQRVADQFPSTYREEKLNLVIVPESQDIVQWNMDFTRAKLFPDSESRREKLWIEATRQARSKKDFSLCLGLARKKDVVENGRFLNVTVVGLKEEILEDIIDLNKRETPVEEVFETQDQEEANQEIPESRVATKEQFNKLLPIASTVAGVVVGAKIGGEFGSMFGVLGTVFFGLVGAGTGGTVVFLGGKVLLDRQTTQVRNEANNSNCEKTNAIDSKVLPYLQNKGTGKNKKEDSIW